MRKLTFGEDECEKSVQDRIDQKTHVESTAYTDKRASYEQVSASKFLFSSVEEESLRSLAQSQPSSGGLFGVLGEAVKAVKIERVSARCVR